MGPAFQIVQVIVSIFLMVLILLQSRGSGGLATPQQDQSTLFRTRRGLEKTLFNGTLLLAVVWVAVSIATVLIANQL